MIVPAPVYFGGMAIGVVQMFIGHGWWCSPGMRAGAVQVFLPRSWASLFGGDCVGSVCVLPSKRGRPKFAICCP
eukprot:10474206-Lingulodinium_polyedra.AAC.1